MKDFLGKLVVVIAVVILRTEWFDDWAETIKSGNLLFDKQGCKLF